MSPTSAGGGTNTKTGGEHISRLVETPLPMAKLEQRRYNIQCPSGKRYYHEQYI